jgi:hypothetical protein
MADNDPQPTEQQNRPVMEFALVVIMLGVLAVLVSTVLLIPLDSTNGLCQDQNTNANSNANDMAGQILTTEQQNQRLVQCREFRLGILDRRKDFLAILLTAFGAWVGAGAAYFFGRENLRVAANSLLRMQRQTSGADRLRTTTINQVPPIPLSWIAQKTDTLGKAYDWLKEDTKRWFIPIVDENGALIFVLKGEALYHYYIDMIEAEQTSPPSPFTPVRDILLSQVIEDINTNDRYSLYRHVYVTVNMNMSVETANELMDRQGIFLAIIVDEHRKPTHYITTTEVRKLLLS